MSIEVRPLSNAGQPLITPDGALYANKPVVFQLVDAVNQRPLSLFDAVDGNFVVSRPITVYTDSAGILSTSLWPNTRGGEVTYYKVTMPETQDKAFFIRVSEGEGSMTLLEAKAAVLPVPPSQTLSLFEAVLANIAAIVDTGFSLVTTTVNGLMSFVDKVRLNLIWGEEVRASSYPTLAEADAAAVALGKSLLIDSQWDIVPATLNAQIHFILGGKLNNAGTVSITKPIVAGRFAIFIGSGAVTLSPGIAGVYPEWFVITGTADDVGLNKAADAVKPAAGSVWNSIDTPHSHAWVNPEAGKVYNIEGKVKHYPGVKLAPAGGYFSLRTNVGYSDPMMVELQFLTSGPEHRLSDISGVRFDAPSGSGVAAIMPHQSTAPGSNGVIVANNRFSKLHFLCPKGLILTALDGSSRNIVYSQENEIDGLLSSGYLDQLVKLSGNMNILRNLNVEYFSGTSTDPFVHLCTGYMSSVGTYGCNATTLSHLVLEGAGSTNKVPLKIEKGRDITVTDLWIETTNNNGYYVDLEDCRGIHFKGKFKTFQPGRVKMRKCHDITIDHFQDDVVTTSYAWYPSRIDMDATCSRLTIGTLTTPAALQAVPVKANLKINTVVATNIISQLNSGAADYLGAVAEVDVAPQGSNLLMNPDWRCDKYGWNLSQAADSIETYTPSDVGPGNMARLKWTAPGALMTMGQTVIAAVPAGWVGKQLDIYVPVKLVGIGQVYAQASGIGLGAVWQYPPAFKVYNYPAANYEDWQIIRISSIIQAAGSAMNFYIFMGNLTAASEVYIGEPILTVAGVASTTPRRLEGFGAPTFGAPRGTQYTRLDGGASTTLYVNTDGGTTWTAK